MTKGSVATKDWTRCLLTETLPYETPLFFSNERLRSTLQRDSSLKTLPDIARQLLIHEKAAEPFLFTVHKGNGGRRPLGVPHPAGQIGVANFYSKFDGFMQNLCGRSRFSLRYPSRIASRFVQSQFATKSDSDDQSVDVDPSSFSQQHDWASSYFSYRPFGRMHLFFSSSAFVELEKNYEFMMQLDVAKCFESMYTHSIAWAVRGKAFTKSNLNAKSFESEFDRVMRNLNWGETNGILIGPEVSRIFAEIVLQAVDCEVEDATKHLDIVIRRYVDDYLLFGHCEKDLAAAKEIIEKELRVHNLHLNDKKTSLARRPLVTNLSIARLAANKLASEFFSHARNSLSDPKQHHFARDAGSTCIQSLRRVAKQHEVEYSSLAAPLLATIERALSSLRRRTGKVAQNQAPPRYASRFIAECIRLSLFIYGTDVRVSTTQKFARILYESALFSRKLRVSNRALEAQYIDAMRYILKASARSRITGPEVVNLLVAVNLVCKRPGAVTLADIERAIGLCGEWKAGVAHLDYFSLVSVLFIGRDRATFSNARGAIVDEIERRVVGCGRNLNERAAETMLFFDFLSCPYISDDRKRSLVQAVAWNVFRSTLSDATANAHSADLGKAVGFVDWGLRTGTRSLRRLLQKKELQPAYD
jgi:hypothetical protein